MRDASPAERVAAALVRHRSRLPRWLARWIESAAKRPDGVAGRLAGWLLGGASGSPPPPTDVPPTEVRVYIGPTNYAGQGWQWARALERSSDRIGARNLSIEIPGTFAFSGDSRVPLVVQNGSDAWQRAEFDAAKKFTHVLFEAERPLFGRLFDRDLRREQEALAASGVSVAFLAHGTDIRSPRRHREASPWSEFADSRREDEVLQRDADENIALLSSAGCPVFVSTPDLLLDAPFASWVPVVVDPSRWATSREILSRPLPVVAHVPSAARAKGTDLIAPVMREMSAQGTLRYELIQGIPSARMPEVIHRADIVLDQFRTGSYGVGACEAMSAGRVVVGHVTDQVRRHIAESTGLALPVVEATPDTLHDVLTGLIADVEGLRRIAALGIAFVESVHAGPLSAQVLRRDWIDLSA